MLRILGIPLRDQDVRWLIGALYRDAHAPAVSAALMLEKGVDRDLYAVGLTREERTAVLGVLDDPPDGLGRVARRADARAAAVVSVCAVRSAGG